MDSNFPVGTRHTAYIRTLRIALIVGFTAEQNEQIGIRKNRLDELELFLHKMFWRMVPVRLSRRFVPSYLYLRDRFGNPSWHRHYSRAALDARRRQMKNPPSRFVSCTADMMGKFDA